MTGTPDYSDESGFKPDNSDVSTDNSNNSNIPNRNFDIHDAERNLNIIDSSTNNSENGSTSHLTRSSIAIETGNTFRNTTKTQGTHVNSIVGAVIGGFVGVVIGGLVLLVVFIVFKRMVGFFCFIFSKTYFKCK